MSSEKDTSGEKAGKEGSPIPLAEPMPPNPTVEPTSPAVSTTSQKEPSPQTAIEQPKQCPNAIPQPMLVRVVEDDELSKFEQRTISYGFAGICVAGLALIAAALTGYFIYEQFQAMEEANEAAGFAANKARYEARSAEQATAKELSALQSQIAAAQGQLTEARRSADIASLQLELTDRPWIVVSGIEGNRNPFPTFVYNDSPTGKRITFNYLLFLKNIGHSAALNISTRTELYVRPRNQGDILNEERKFCKNNTPERISAGGVALFPNDPPREVGNARDSIIHPEHIVVYDSLPSIALTLIGCVDYQYESSSRHHHTWFAWDLRRKPRNLLYFPIDEDVVGGDIGLYKDDYADYTD